MRKYIPEIDSPENFRRGDELDPRSPWYEEPPTDEELEYMIEHMDDWLIDQAEDAAFDRDHPCI